MFTGVFTRSYDEFEKTMIQQSFAFVSLPVIGSDEPSLVPGQYGSGAIGKVQFQSDAVAWIERFVQTVMIPGCRVVQRLDPYCLHNGGPVHGMLALYVPRSNASAMRIQEVQVPPPCGDPSCGLVFVTQRGFPVDRGNGWCISFDLAINDYELDCISRLQCLLQGLCPRLPDQLHQARDRSKLCPETAKRFEMVLRRTSATRHPKPLTLFEAIRLVAFCTRRRSNKRVRFPDEIRGDAASPASLSPPPTPTGVPPKRPKMWEMPHLVSAPSPGPLEGALLSKPPSMLQSSESVDPPLAFLPSPGSNMDSNELSTLSPKNIHRQSESHLQSAPSPTSVETSELVLSTAEPETLQSPGKLVASSEHESDDTTELLQLSPPLSNSSDLTGGLLTNEVSSDMTLVCGSTQPLPTLEASARPSTEQAAREPMQIYSPLTLSPFPSPLSDPRSRTEIGQTQGDFANDQSALEDDDERMEEIDQVEGVEEYPDYLDDGIRTPMPLGITTVCPPEIDTRDRVIVTSPREPDICQKAQTPLEPSKICKDRGISRRYSTARSYEYAYSVASVAAYNKFQETIDDDHRVKLAYAFPDVDETAMSSLYPCVISLVKVEVWSIETFEVFGATTLRQAIELVLRLHTKPTSKCADAYLLRTADTQCTNVPVDVPLDDGVPVEEVVLKRYPKETVDSMRREAGHGQVIYAWQPGGAVYAVRKCQHMKTLSGFGIPKRKHGHQPPISCETDDEIYRQLYAQPKTLVISRALQLIVKKTVPFLKSNAYNRGREVNIYFPSSIVSSGDWLADHHIEIASAVSRFVQDGRSSAHDSFPLECKLLSQRCLEMQTQGGNLLTLNEFLIYYLELLELISCSGTVIGDAVFFKHRRNGTADFILDVVFSRAQSLARLFKETDNKKECLWVSRTRL